MLNPPSAPTGPEPGRDRAGGRAVRAWRHLHAWLRKVPIPDPDLRENAVLVQVIGGLGVAGEILAALLLYRNPANAEPGAVLSFVIAAAVLAVAVALVRFGHYRLSLWIICLSLFINAAIPMVSGGVTYGLGFSRQMSIPLAVAALLLSRRALWTMFGLILVIAALGVAREHGLIGAAVIRPPAIPPFGAFGSTLVVFFFIAVVLDRVAGALRASLARTREREESLAESEANLRYMLDMFPDAAVMVRLDNQEFVAVSGGFTKHSGLTLADVAGKTAADFNLWVDPQDRARYLDAIRRDGSVTDMEARFHLRNGRIADTLVWGKVITIGGVPHLLTAFRDITDWKRAQEDRERMQEQVQHAQRLDSLGSLAGGVAHDFNNMLGGIMAFADLLLVDEKDPTRIAHLRAILKAASRSGELTKKLLAFGRKGKNLVEPVDLQLVARECLALLKPTMSPDLQVEVAMDACPTVDADPGQMHQVVLNLCINAMEAMPVPGRLTLATRRRILDAPTAADLTLPPGNYLELEVSDTGIGMPEEVRQRIFEPFFTTKSELGKAGTGLGLSTVYGIVHSHRGTIEVESKPGLGSRFKVLLPEGGLSSTQTDSGPVPRIGKGTILLVEDEALLREAAASALESLGYTVQSAENGVAGVEAFRFHHKHLFAVLLDLKMPLMGGREAFEAMRRLDPEVPVLVCTGFGENEEVQALRSAGAVGMLSKPYRIRDLEEALRRLSPR